MSPTGETGMSYFCLGKDKAIAHLTRTNRPVYASFTVILFSSFNVERQ